MKYHHDHIHLTTQSVDAWVHWYTASMGATVTRRSSDSGNVMIDLDVGGVSVRISNRTGVEMQMSERAGLTVLPPEGFHHLGFLVDDIDAWVADLVAKGASLATPVGQASPTVRYAFLKLPTGLLVEAVQQSEE